MIRTRTPIIAGLLLAAMAASALAAGSAVQPSAGQLISSGGVAAYQPEPYGGSGLILFSNGIVINTDQGQPALPENLSIKGYAPGETGYYIVQFTGPIQQSWKQELSGTGAKILSYLPNYAFVVRMNADQENQVRSLSAVRWVGPYQPAYKISGQPELKAKQGLLTVTIIMHYDESMEATLSDLKALGATILESTTSDYDKFIKAQIDLAVLDRVAGLKAVSWVEPWYPNKLQNDVCQWTVQDNTSNTRNIWDKGLRGEGQVISTSDSGVRVDHNMFNDVSVPITTWGNYPDHRKIVAYQPTVPGSSCFGDESANEYHGSHTAGTVCGDDSATGGASPYDGMALKARLFFMDAGDASGNLWIYNDLGLLFDQPHSGVAGRPETKAYIMSNSWGAQQTSGPMSYDAECQSLDQYTWNHKDFLPFFSQGNNDAGNYIGRPAVSKNCVAVGASRNGANAGTLASFSVYGPTVDQRKKPMLVAPGDGILVNSGLYSVNGATTNGYAQMMGTSMSSPAAAGATVLMRQYFTEGWYPSGTKTPADAFTPTAALLKAVLLAGADKGTPAIPDTRYGWGRVDLDSSLYFSGDGRKLAVIDDTTGLVTGQYKDYTIIVPDSLRKLRAALCWTDYPGMPGAARMLVNDLDLTLTDPYGTAYKGNVFATSQSSTGGTADTLNVEENFLRNASAYRPGTWKLRVSARNTPQGPQPYAIAITGPLTGSLSWTPAPLIGMQSCTVLDAGQSRPNSKLDPGETDTLRIVMINSGPVDANSVTAKLRTASTYCTRIDSTGDYGTVAANGGTSNGDDFLVTMSAATPEGTTVPFVLHWVDAGGDSADIAFNLVCGIARYATYDHNVGNVLLTVTKWGSIGYLQVNANGNGFKYPQSTQWLYHASFMAGNAANYVCDRFYPNTGYTGADSANTDWKCLTRSDSGVTAVGAVVSDQDSWAQFNDSSFNYTGGSAKGLTVTQEGFAWLAPYDFVILKYKLQNRGPSTLSNMYAGIVADFDMGASSATNLGEADTLTRKAVYERQQTTDNPCVGLKLLQGTLCNASLLQNNYGSVTNPGYVYNGSTNLWNDSTAYKFLDGAIKKPSALTTADTADYSSFISAGPFTLNSGDSTTVAFAFVAGASTANFWSMCDSAQAMYNRTFLGVSGAPAATAPTRPVSLSRNRPNPFAAFTSISYQLPGRTAVSLRVYNIAGQLVKTLVNGMQAAGAYSVTWDGRDGQNNRVAAGIYVYSLDTGTGQINRKMIMLK